MISVYINGIMQIPGIDYVSSDNSIAFSTAPQAMATIEIRSIRGVLARIFGDGSSYRFDIMSVFEHGMSEMLEDAFKLRHIPAVADVLERLQVVVSLAKENG